MPNDKQAENRLVLTTGMHSKFDDDSSFSDRCTRIGCGHSRADHLVTFQALNPAAVGKCRVEVNHKKTAVGASGAIVVEGGIVQDTIVITPCECVQWQRGI